MRKATELRRGGWRVLTVWEHELRAAPARSAEAVRQALES